MKWIGAFVLSFTLLLLVEGILYFLPLEPTDRFFVLGKNHPVFITGDGDQADLFVTNPHFKGALNFQSFRKEKPAGTIRIFIVGGSAAYGWPGGDRYAFTGYLRRALEAVSPGRYEIVNASGMSFGSRRVLDILTDVVAFQPDLVIIYSGNNEYVERNTLTPAQIRGGILIWMRDQLRRTNIYRGVRWIFFRSIPSLGRSRSSLDYTDLRSSPRVRRGAINRSDQSDKMVLSDYERNIGQMAKLLDRSGIEGVFFTVPVNLAEWAPQWIRPPFRTQQDALAWGENMKRADEALLEGDHRRAEPYLAKGIELAPRFAPAYYSLGRVGLRLGNGRARELLSMARDLDARPLRALDAFNDALRSIGQRARGIRVLDVEKLFENESATGIPGRDLFLDYCHPNESGHKLIARAVLRVLSDRLDPDLPLHDLDSRIAGDDAAGDRNPEELAHLYYALGMSSQNQGDLSAAAEAYSLLLKIMPGFSEAYSNLGTMAVQKGNLADAEAFFLKALEADPGNTSALLNIGKILEGRQNPGDAEKCYREILRLSSAQPEALERLALLLLVQEGKAEEALSLLRQAESLGFDTARVHMGMGLALLQLNDQEAARRELETALMIDPVDLEARRLLDGLPRGE